MIFIDKNGILKITDDNEEAASSSDDKIQLEKEKNENNQSNE